MTRGVMTWAHTHPMPEHASLAAGAWLPVLFLLPAALAYAGGVLRLHRRGDRWPAYRTVYAAGGLLALAAALGPVGAGSGMDFRRHVLQHLLLAMLGPFLLAMSAPMTLALRALGTLSRRRLLAVLHSRLARVMTLAPVVLVLEVGGLYAYYLTPLFGYSHDHLWAHVAVHLHMFVAGCLLSWYVIARDPMPGRPTTRGALIVLLLAAGSHDLLTKLMYAHALPAGAGSPDEVRAGAQLMFYGGDVVELLLAVAVMTAWYARTGRRLRQESRRRGGAGSEPAVRPDGPCGDDRPSGSRRPPRPRAGRPAGVR